MYLSFVSYASETILEAMFEFASTAYLGMKPNNSGWNFSIVS